MASQKQIQVLVDTKKQPQTNSTPEYNKQYKISYLLLSNYKQAIAP